MRYGEIAKIIREETRRMESSVSRMNALADELERTDSTTPKIGEPVELKQGKMIMTIAEVSDALGISKPLVQRLTHRDDFPSIRVGRRVLINAKKLQEWLDNQTEISEEPF